MGMIFNDWKKDLPASFVVFLVALPLCLGIALASGAPLYAGIITGIVGGIVVGSLSGSHLSVSGPAAGLTVVVFQSIQNLGGYSCFLLALVFARVLQIFLGILKAGSLSAFFPFSVIKGMLAAIGIILILNQIPVILGIQEWTLPKSWDRSNWVSVFLGSSSILFLFLWDRWNQKFLKLIPASLAVIVWAFGIEILLEIFQPDWKLQPSHRVQIPIIGELQQFFLHIDKPDFSEWKNLAVYKVAIAICLIASLETLLSVEAMDTLDPEKQITPTNRELVAQGFGNLLCGLLSGIPLTAVIVRSTVNLNSGAKTRLSCILHGIWLLFAMEPIAFPLRKIFSF